jgi:hypothetical protein
MSCADPAPEADPTTLPAESGDRSEARPTASSHTTSLAFDPGERPTLAAETPEGDGKGDYDVGYGKPPKATRFQPGRSGNPKGRPRGRKNLRTILEETLFKSVMVTESGQKRRVPAIEAAFLRLLNKALEGDLRAFNTLGRYLPQLEQTAVAESTGTESTRPSNPERDAKILELYTKMIRESVLQEEADDEQQ